MRDRGTFVKSAAAVVTGSRREADPARTCLGSPPVTRRAMLHPLAPIVAAAGVATVYLILTPATADIAAHSYRAWLWDELGFAVWNAQWYGGHHMAGYSMLSPPIQAVLGTYLTGSLAAVASVWCFGTVARRLASTPRAAELATWLFAAGALGNLIVGRVPFALGIAFAMAAWACVRRSLVAAGLLSLACVWASPVAGVYVCAGALAALVTGDRRAALALGVPSLIGGVAMAVAFPEGGTDRFVATAFWPMLVLSLCALALLDPARRTTLWAAIFYVAILAAAFAFSNPLGQNALRPGLLIGPSLLVLCPRPGAPRAAIAVVCAGLVYLSILPAVRAIEEARGDPSSQAAFHSEVLEFLATHARPGERLEVPLTVNHWETFFLARRYPIARGWHRQLDRGANAIFYDGKPLTPARYERWLRDNAVRWIALPDVPLDFSAQSERQLLLAGQPYLREVLDSGDWRIWEVLGPAPAVTGPARLTAVHPDGFDLEADRPGRVVVRQRMTPYWTVTEGAGCVSEDGRTGWTAVDVRRAGPLKVRARFSLGRALRRLPGCPGDGGGGRP